MDRNKFYRVVTVDLKQAIGLKKEKPSLEVILNRLYAQGFLAVHFLDHDGAITAICEKQIDVSEPELETPPDLRAVTKAESGKAEDLGQPEVVDAAG